MSEFVTPFEENTEAGDLSNPILPATRSPRTGGLAKSRYPNY
jgi:hypothetical protein